MATYQGPVPQGASESLFRNTGKTGVVDSSGNFQQWKTYGGGGGSSRSSDRQREAEFIKAEQTRKEAEQKARQEEARKKFEAEQKAREEKAFSQTTVGQLTSQKDRDNKLVQTYIHNEENKQFISDYDRAKEFERQLGINQQSSSSNNFVSGLVEGKRGRLMSTLTPTLNQIDTAVSSGAVSGSSGLFGTSKVVQETIQKRYESDYQREIDKKIAEEEKRLSDKFNTYQDVINRGGDYGVQSSLYKTEEEEANKRIQQFSDEYSKGWLTGAGSQVNIYGQQALELRKDIYAKQDIQRKALSIFGIGAGVGAGVTAGTMGGKALLSKAFGVTFKAGKSVLGKTLGAGIGIAYTAYELGKSGLYAKIRYDTYKGLGYSTKESLAFSSYAGATKLAPSAFGVGGAMTGGLAVAGATNYLTAGNLAGGLSKAEQKLVNKALARENAIKQEVKNEILTESQLKKVGLEIPGGRTNILGTKQTGTAVRRIDLSINQEGLSKAEQKAVKKLNYRGRTYQSVNIIDDVVQSSEATRVKTGGIFGQKSTSLSSFEGRSTGDILMGTRVTATTSGKEGEVFFERVIGKGKVAYGEGLFGTPVRGEIGQGVSVRLGGFKLRNGKVIGADTSVSAITGKQYSLQQLGRTSFNGKITGKGFFKTGKDALGNEIIKSGVVGDVQKTNTYLGLKGTGTGGNKKVQTIIDLFGSKPKPTRSVKTSNGEGLIVTSSTQQASVLKPITANVLESPKGLVPLGNALTNYPTLVGGQGGRSAYAGVVANRIPAFYSDASGIFSKDISLGIGGRGITGMSVLGTGTKRTASPQIFNLEPAPSNLFQIPSNVLVNVPKPITRNGEFIRSSGTMSFAVPIELTRQNQNLGQPQSLKFRQKQLYKERLIQKQLQLPLMNTFPFSPLYPRAPKIPPFGFILPKMAQFGGSSFGLKQMRGTRTGYQPSFTASTLNIRKSSKPILGGSLQVRNIIGAPIRRKKKRRKK